MNTQHRITSGLAVTVALTLAAGAPAALANPTQQLYGAAGRPNQEKQINTGGSVSARANDRPDQLTGAVALTGATPASAPPAASRSR